jgi:predicted amidohydrolase
MNKTKIALLCYTQEDSVEMNKEKVSRLLKKVEGADFVLLPEFSLDPGCRHSEKIPGEITHWFQEKAQIHSANIIGNLIEKSDRSCYNTCVVINRKGHLVGTYRKIQLSHEDRERHKLSPGKSLCVFYIEGIPFGVSTCYDVWYPETARNMVLTGAKLVFVPFREEKYYIPYIRNLVRARAIENVIPLAGCGAEFSNPLFKVNSKNFAFFVLPSGKFIKEESRREIAVHTFPSLDTMITREKSNKKWERPFDGTVKFKIDKIES